jgi:hypothetical protein
MDKLLMATRFLTPISTGVVLAVIVTACNPGSTTSQPKPAAKPVETEQSVPTEPAPTDGNLLTYDGPATSFPITAQYPDTMQVDGGCADEGCGFFFTFKPQNNAMDNAEVYIFLPAGVATAADQQPFVTGPDGLIENAGWVVSSVETEGSEQFPYPWLETVINFGTDQEEAGHILLGQADGQAVQVILKYPVEMAASYWNNASTILETLEFDADLLPLNVSTEGPPAEAGPDTECDPENEPC